MDVENELTIEGIAQLDSSFDRNSNRHRVVIELESGVFEFARMIRLVWSGWITKAAGDGSAS